MSPTSPRWPNWSPCCANAASSICAGSLCSPAVWTETSFDGCSTDHPHPFVGPITTTNRRAALTQLSQRIAEHPDKIDHRIGVRDGIPTVSYTLLILDGVAKLLDPGFTLGAKSLDTWNALLDDALYLAQAKGATAMAMIKDRADEPFFRSKAFREVGWLSWLYISADKLQRLP